MIGFVLPLLLPTLTIWFSLDQKRNVSRIGTLFSLDHKLYAFDYDSDVDSVASEKQILRHSLESFLAHQYSEDHSRRNYRLGHADFKTLN